MKPKIAIVLPFFGDGGAEHMVSRLASHIDLNKVDVEVICLYGSPMNNMLENAILNHGIQIKYVGKGKGFSINAIRRLNKELSEFGPDIIHTHLSACVYCALWVLTHSVVMLHTVHNMPAYELIKPKRIVMSLLYRSKKVVPVAISDEIQRQMNEYYRIKNTCELVYNPVDIERYLCKRTVRDNKYTVINIGRLSAQKNQKMLIDAFISVHQAIPYSQLYILGDGPLKDELSDYIKENNLSDCVHLEGRVDNVEDYLASADVFALSSNYEGLPLVILEAMASGLPIISTDVGGVKDIVTDNGLLVKAGDYEQLSEALILLGKSVEKRSTFSTNSVSNVQLFGCDMIASQYVALYMQYSGMR